MKIFFFIIIGAFLSDWLLATDIPQSKVDLAKIVSEKKQTDEKQIEQLSKLLDSKKESEVIKLIKSDKSYSLINQEVHGERVLTYCIKNKMWGVAEELIKSGSNLNHKDKDGKVALMYAAEAKNKYITTLIVATKADKGIKDKNGVTAAEYIKKNGLM